MKLIFATGIFPPDIGGPATYVARLAAEFQRRGFDVRVIAYSSAKDKEYGFPVTRISRKWPKGLRHFIYFLKLLKLTKNCDVIFAQNVTSAGFPALLAAKLMKKVLILKIVGDAAWEQNKGHLRVVQGAVARLAGKIIVPSLYLKKRVMGWRVPEDKIVVIYNAPEPRENSRLLDISKGEAKQKLGLSGNIILSVGRFAPWKGFFDLISIMPDLLKENPAFCLVIVGDGQDRKNLESEIKNLKLEDRVKLTGSVPHSQMPLYFKAADVFVLNSGYEGLSHVILEAMQHGVPVIASAEGGNPELIENGANGFLVEYKNQEQLKSAILKLWQDKNLQEKFIQNSKEKLKNFTWENLVGKTLQILKR
ncbi:MAG: Glycosyltransferase [Parcubacteria group bacterium GW2011_GWB1_41_4]|nr:MAG: Glycosyltransferase [Parcubacteria group bacterium GW2011_GWB1_41_4]